MAKENCGLFTFIDSFAGLNHPGVNNSNSFDCLIHIMFKFAERRFRSNYMFASRVCTLEQLWKTRSRIEDQYYFSVWDGGGAENGSSFLSLIKG